jgi:hypothetical protein
MAGIWPAGNIYAWYVMAAAWIWLLWGPWPLKAEEETKFPQALISWQHLRYITLVMFLFFILAAYVHSLLGNYLLWMKMIYLIAFTGRFAVAARLARENPHYSFLICWLVLWAMLAQAVMLWNPAYMTIYIWAWLAAMLALWTAACGLLINLLRNQAIHAICLCLICLGPLPPLALAWTDAAFWILLFIVFLLLFCKLQRSRVVYQEENKLDSARNKGEGLWFPLWLFRSAFLLWWCLGCGLILSLAWWVPESEHYLRENAWVKALCLSMFVLICLGLLLEYLLPLLGRPEPTGRWRRDKSWGPALSASALLLALIPMLWLPVTEKWNNNYLQRVRLAITDEPFILSQDHSEMMIPLPEEIDNIKRIYIVSRIQNGVQVVQTQALAMIALVMDAGLPDFLYLRAGIDTADQDLGRSRIKSQARHQTAPLADYYPAFSADGQAYHQQNYFTGFFLQNAPGNKNVAINLKYMPPLDHNPEYPWPQLIVEKILLE